MKSAVPIAVLAILFPLAACKSIQPGTVSSPATSAQRSAVPPGATGFDYYLLNLSWSPEFCYSHREAPECASRNTFVLHGLWPQNNNGSYPENCSDAPGPADPSSFSDIYPDQGLLQHEWHTHGSCTGLSGDAFFTTARMAYRSVAVPSELQSITRQISMPPDEVISLFTRTNPSIPAESLVVSCGHNFLTAVEVCLDKSLHPVACGPVRSCRARTIRIPPPN